MAKLTDKERLDWFEMHRGRLDSWSTMTGKRYWVCAPLDRKARRGASARQALDAAIRAEQAAKAERILEKLLMFYAPNGESGWNGVADDAREFLGLPRTLPKGGL